MNSSQPPPDLFSPLSRRELLSAVGTLCLAGCVRAVGPDPALPSSTAGGRPLDAAAFVAERRFARTPFGRTAFVERGSGPAALFLHGFPLCGFQWRGALERLSSVRRCIAPDFMGLGATEVNDGQSVAPEAQVRMLLALLDALGVAEVDLVANDSGGAVAQLLVAHHPERVRTLLLTNCDTEPESPPPAMGPVIEMARAGTYVDRWLRPWLEDKALARSKDGLGGMTFMDPSHPTDEALELYLGPLVRTARGRALVDAYAIALGVNPLVGVTSILRQRRLPVRILWGMADTIFTPAGAELLDRTFPGSRGVQPIPDAKLFFPEERPEVIAAEARALWEVAPSRPTR